MSHFTKDYVKFLKDLAANNNRDWFHENKKRYEESIKKPFEEFVQAVIDRLAKHDKALKDADPKKCIFRIHRDIRFSKDKTPYKTNMSAVITPGGRKDMDSVGIYLEMGPEHVRVYGGVYMPDTQGKEKIRNAIAGDLKGFDKAISAKKFKDLFGEVRGEKNKTIPKEIRAAGEKQPLLYNKAWYYFSQLPPKEITNEKLIDMIEERYKASLPLSKYLMSAMG